MSKEAEHPRSRAEERALTDPAVRRRTRGSVLLTTGVIVLLFDLLMVPLVPADIRSGHRFWTTIFAVVTIAALALIVAGVWQRRKTRPLSEEENVE